METIKTYLVGITPYLEARQQDLSSQMETEETKNESAFITNLLKEIAELTALKGEQDGKENV